MAEIKVISVGNIAMGGTGKTPHTIEITNEYIKRGKKVVILSRGYKGEAGYGLNVISDGKTIFNKPPYAADEPYMMAVNCSGAAVITGKERKLSLSYAEENFSSDIAVLDDGFQHRKLKRDADILLLDYRRPISTGFPFPFGYLREMPPSIKRADIIVFTRANDDIIPECVKKYTEGKPVFFSRTKTDYIIFKGEKIMLSDIKGEKAGIFSAVASNKSFYNTLLSSGIQIETFKGMRDHYKPSDKMLDVLISESKSRGAEFFITTEKDFVKLNDEYKNIFSYLKMEIIINRREDFFKEIDKKISYYK